MYNQSVTKDWVMELPFRMQSVLMAALRGYDLAKKDDDCKLISRSIRSLVLNNADPTNSFITSDIPDKTISDRWLWDIDAFPMHFVCHTAHAIEIIGYKHPEEKIRNWYLEYYKKLVKGFHLNFETEAQLDVRLGFTTAEEKIRDARDKVLTTTIASKVEKVLKRVTKEKWDAGTGTSHGGRDRSYSGSS
jgi:hypothetical protein